MATIQVRFLKDYDGYFKGEHAVLQEDLARCLVSEGKAEYPKQLKRKVRKTEKAALDKGDK